MILTTLNGVLKGSTKKYSKTLFAHGKKVDEHNQHLILSLTHIEKLWVGDVKSHVAATIPGQARLSTTHLKGSRRFRRQFSIQFQ